MGEPDNAVEAGRVRLLLPGAIAKRESSVPRFEAAGIDVVAVGEPDGGLCDELWTGAGGVGAVLGSSLSRAFVCDGAAEFTRRRTHRRT